MWYNSQLALLCIFATFDWKFHPSSSFFLRNGVSLFKIVQQLVLLVSCLIIVMCWWVHACSDTDPTIVNAICLWALSPQSLIWVHGAHCLVGLCSCCCTCTAQGRSRTWRIVLQLLPGLLRRAETNRFILAMLSLCGANAAAGTFYFYFGWVEGRKNLFLPLIWFVMAGILCLTAS